MDLERLSAGDLFGLNRLCKALKTMNDADYKKLNAVVPLADTSGIAPLCHLAENLDQFDFIPGIHTPEEYGKYMIQKSGHFNYDSNLDGFYNYHLYGERRVREEGGKFNECGYVVYHGTLILEDLMRDSSMEQSPQMGGLAYCFFTSSPERSWRGG